MPQLRTRMWLTLPVLLLFVLYWPGLTTWFYQDDFGWLNLRHDVHSAADLAAALFAPKAHGNMRPLGENAYWLGLSAVFGADPLPFHLATFLTQSASLILLGAIARRLFRSQVAAVAAPLLWLVNIGLAPAMAWSSIYNQVLSAFFFLLAFYFLLRAIETGRRAHSLAHWGAFVLGLGALEINVVYPALAVLYAWFYARDWVRPVLPMFAVSAASVAAHFYFAPPSHAGVYAPRVDAALFPTLYAYWRWALGPMPQALAIAMLAAVAVLIVWGIRRGDYLPLVSAAWFLFPLLPYLPLPEHKMDYYLAVPATGIALLGSCALGAMRTSRLPARAATIACIAWYAAVSVPASASAVRWQHARGEKVEDLVLGVEEARAAAPGKIILLDGIDTDLFWSGIADLPFRARGVPGVYLAPNRETPIDAPPELLSKYTLPAAIARTLFAAGSAAVYRFDGSLLHDETLRAAARWTEDEPRFVNLGDPVFAAFVGAGWEPPADACRRMKGPASLRIGAPRHAGEALYLGIFETHEVRPGVTVNGVACPLTVSHRDNDLTEFRAALPPPSLEWKQLEVSIRNSRPLLFGYAEVR
ncbi:MAG: hypothetical protein ABI759_26810 [Candidatus Solibacter sp.]